MFKQLTDNTYSNLGFRMDGYWNSNLDFSKRKFLIWLSSEQGKQKSDFDFHFPFSGFFFHIQVYIATPDSCKSNISDCLLITLFICIFITMTVFRTHFALPQCVYKYEREIYHGLSLQAICYNGKKNTSNANKR